MLSDDMQRVKEIVEKVEQYDNFKKSLRSTLEKTVSTLYPPSKKNNNGAGESSCSEQSSGNDEPSGLDIVPENYQQLDQLDES